jgi:hypothetical protein
MVSELPPVDRSVGKKDFAAELPDDGFVGAPAGGSYLPGDPSGIEDGVARPAEHGGHRALSGTDVAGQAEDLSCPGL